MAVLKIKDWIKSKSAQFYMAGPNKAIRHKDFQEFVSIEHKEDPKGAKIIYNGRKGMLLEFMSNMILVQIEVRKPNYREMPDMEFNPENYEVIHVPINHIERR